MEKHKQKWLGWMNTLRKKLAKHEKTLEKVAWMDENPKETLSKTWKKHQQKWLGWMNTLRKN